MSQKNIWIDAWQMQCCGTAFNVGDVVQWTAVAWAFELSQISEIMSIDYGYENHGDGSEVTIRGVVTEIYAVYESYELDSKRNVMIPVSGKLIRHQTQAIGWESDLPDGKFAAYYVRLNACEECNYE